MSEENIRAGRTPKSRKAKTALPKGKNYLFVIGIDQYEFQPRLYNAVKDAKDVCDVLTKRYQFAAEGEHCFTLFDQDATQKAIFNKLRDIAKMVTDQDNLLIYFSGHGEFDDIIDEGFWIPCDGEPGNIGSFISFSVLTRYVKAIKSFHTFIIADSCYAGSFFTERRSKEEANTYLESIPSRWLLTAGRNEVVADGKQGDNSPFADAVLYCLRNNKEERLSVSIFCERVKTDVTRNAHQVPRGAPLHGVGDRGGEFMFRLKKVANKIYKDNLINRPESPAVRRDTKKLQDIEQEEDNTENPFTPEPLMPTMHNLGELQKQIKLLIAEDEFIKTFELFSNAVNEKVTVANTLISLQGQYNSMRKQQNQGTVSDDFAMRTYNRIRVALTDIANKLELEDLNAGFLQSAPGNNIGNVTSNLTALERQGLENQITILQKKLNFLLEQQAILSDPSQKFTLQMQMDETQKQIKESKSKLGIQ